MLFNISNFPSEWTWDYSDRMMPCVYDADHVLGCLAWFQHSICTSMCLVIVALFFCQDIEVLNVKTGLFGLYLSVFAALGWSVEMLYVTFFF